MERDQAFGILKQYVTRESLIKHCLAVEAAMKHFAQIYKQDVEKWQVIGLLHDIDYEQYPDQHCIKCKEILEKEGLSKEDIHSIQSHGYGIVQHEIKPEKQMEKILYTVDELTGLITAAAFMQPNKTLEEVNLKSLKKKWKTKGFAAKVDRELIAKGAQMAGLELEEVLSQTLLALQKEHEVLGL